METIQQIANDKVSAMIVDGSIKAAIEVGIENAILRAIVNQFERNSPFVKQLEDALKTGLAINTQELPFETYNQQMLIAVKGKLGNLFSGGAAEKFMDELDKTLAPAPQQISILELIETIVKLWIDDPYDQDNLGDFAKVKLTKGSIGDTYSLQMWKNEADRTAYSSSANVNLHINNGVVRINHNHDYNPTCFEDYQAYIFKLYAAGTTITGLADFDPEEHEFRLKDDYND